MNKLSRHGRSRSQLTVIILGLLFLILWISFGSPGHDKQQSGVKQGTVISTSDLSSHRESVARQLWGMDPQPDYWPAYFDKLDHEKLAPLTAEAQKWIYHKLHPENVLCRRQKYLSYGWHLGGLGSIIHVGTAYLANALENDALFVWHPTQVGGGSMFADEGCGRGEANSNFLCFFKPPSACGYEWTNAHNQLPDPGESKGGVPSYLEGRLREVLGDREISADFVKYWWRAQGAAYLMRLNSQTLNILADMRLNRTLNDGVIVSSDGSTRQIPVPFPLPSGIFHAHIRHGDKSVEMQLLDLPVYITKAEQVVAENPLAYFKTIFVSTEDQAVIDAARKQLSIGQGTTANHAWTVYTSNIHRINGSPYEQLKEFGKSQMTHEWLHQLVMSLEADIEIGTMGSNWNRMISELKCIWVDKCHMPYFEVGAPSSWIAYEW
eukprot:Partr_v1_DN26765_c1_g1_i3_m8637